MREILILDPVTRIKTDDLLHHPWLSSNYNSNMDAPKFDDDLSTMEYQTISNVPVKNDASHFIMDQVTNKMKLLVTSSKTKRSIFRDSFSLRARKHFAGVDEDGSKIIISKRKENSKNDQTAPIKINGLLKIIMRMIMVTALHTFLAMKLKTLRGLEVLDIVKDSVSGCQRKVFRCH